MAEPFHATFSVPVAAPSLIVELSAESEVVMVPFIAVNDVIVTAPEVANVPERLALRVRTGAVRPEVVKVKWFVAPVAPLKV